MTQPAADPSEILRITNSPCNFAWGKVDGLTHRLGLPETGDPQAELWLGAHPAHPAEFLDQKLPWQNVQEWEESTQETLPFLLKTLAVDQVLSLQTHPGKTLAIRGYTSENKARLPIHGSDRNYRDPHPKPELIVALDDHFVALCGFRKRSEAIKLLAVLSEQHGPGRSKVFDDFAARVESAPLRDIVSWVLTPGDEQQNLYSAVTEALSAGIPLDSDAAFFSEACNVLADICRQYPGDLALLFALLLQHHHLDRGEALWLPVGTPHAYVSGFGVEVMGPSDNVLRGGLTTKHVDIHELTTALNYDETRTHRIQGAIDGNSETYAPEFSIEDGEPFQLTRCTGDAVLKFATRACVLVTDGEFTVSTVQDTQVFRRGEAALLPAGDVVVGGSGQIFFAAGTDAHQSDTSNVVSAR